MRAYVVKSPNTVKGVHSAPEGGSKPGIKEFKISRVESPLWISLSLCNAFLLLYVINTSNIDC